MEILNNLWNVMITENENLTKYVSLSLIFIEIYVVMKFFTTVLDINYSKKQRNAYMILFGILTIITNLFVPINFNTFITLLLLPTIIKFIFKTSILKSIIAEILTMITTLILETLYLKICFSFFGITPNQCKNIIIYRVPFMITIYLTIFILSKIMGAIKVNWNTFENLSKHHKRLLILNLIFVLICVAAQFYLLIFYNQTLPIYITLISLLSLLTYSSISIYSIIKTLLLEKTKKRINKIIALFDKGDKNEGLSGIAAAQRK